MEKYLLLLSMPLVIYSFEDFSYIKGGKLFYEKTTNFMKQCANDKQCDCYKQKLSKGFSKDEITAFLKLPPVDQGIMMDIVLKLVHTACNGKK